MDKDEVLVSVHLRDGSVSVYTITGGEYYSAQAKAVNSIDANDTTITVKHDDGTAILVAQNVLKVDIYAS